jgi:arabinofuranosyltransferase
MNARWHRAVAILAVALVAIGLVRSAWLCDDAYITLRTVDNWVNGYGLRWNIAERVQTYTHPLWMFVLSAVYVFTREPYYTTLSVALGTSTIALVLVAMSSHASFRATLAVLTLGASHAFVHYSTSGLENPLSNLLLIGLVLRLATGASSPKRLMQATLIGSLIALNRADYVLLVGPIIAFELWSVRSIAGVRAALRAVLVGLSPFIIWEFFSVFYYGSFVPNTAYAKLNHNIDRWKVIKQGFGWVAFTAKHDWPTVIATLAACVIVFIDRTPRWIACAVGALIYLAYVVWIGGDFMGGRFWVAPLVISVGVLVVAKRRAATWALGLTVLSSLFLPFKPIPFGGNPRGVLAYETGVWDERASYFPQLGLLNVGWGRRGPLHPWGAWGLREGQQMSVTIRSAVGMHGYYGGPRLFVIDDLALADPILSHLKPLPNERLLVGHLKRVVPLGYFESVVGDNVITDPSLKRYYDIVREVTRGPLWSLHRIKTALLLALGHFKPLIAEYESRTTHLHLSQPVLTHFGSVGESPACHRCLSIIAHGEVESDRKVEHPIRCTVLVEAEKTYRLEWIDGDVLVGESTLRARGQAWHVVESPIIPPPAVNRSGFNRLAVTALDGELPLLFGGVQCESAIGQGP